MIDLARLGYVTLCVGWIVLDWIGLDWTRLNWAWFGLTELRGTRFG